MEKITIEGRDLLYKKVHRKVRSARLEFEDGLLTIILPENFKDGEKLINQHKRWILKQIEKFEELKRHSKKMTINRKLDINSFQKQVTKKIAKFSQEFGVSVKDISFKKLKSRWGSCSSDGKITINTLLRFLPERYIEYITFHEVLHRIEKRHNKRFYTLLKEKFLDKELIEKDLATYWYLLSNKKI